MTNELGGRRRAGLPGCNFQFSVTLVTFLVTAHTPTKRIVYQSPKYLYLLVLVLVAAVYIVITFIQPLSLIYVIQMQ